jgi:hypothetical protein
LNIREIEMYKIAIVGLALATVLMSGFLFNAQAQCYFGCLPNISTPPCATCQTPDRDRDFDRPDATCQGAYNYGPTTPDPMGSPGV